MRLHGIELAKPDEWYVSTSDENGGFFEYVAVSGEQVHVPTEPELDFFYLDRHSSAAWNVTKRLREACLSHRVYFGPTGTVVAEGFSRDEAIRNAIRPMTEKEIATWERRIIGWLETHPLSPRYRWTGGR